MPLEVESLPRGTGRLAGAWGRGAAHPTFTRRGVLLAAVASSSLACRSRSSVATGPAPGASTQGAGAPAALASGLSGSPSFGGLEVARLGDLKESERGGTAVVLLHGWGARGDDLLPLAHHLARPRTRFFVPAGPLAQGSGRAWWDLNNAADRPAHAWDDEVPAGYRAHPQVLRVRQAIQGLLRDVRARYAPDLLVLAGFSQGAMLSLDVALAAEPAVDRVVALSGVLLAESIDGLRAPRSQRPSVFISHGRQDPVLPFKGGESASRLLAKHGFPVTFHPFDGGHEIPPEVVAAFASFAFGGS